MGKLGENKSVEEMYLSLTLEFIIMEGVGLCFENAWTLEEKAAVLRELGSALSPPSPAPPSLTAQYEPYFECASQSDTIHSLRLFYKNNESGILFGKPVVFSSL
jgi:hypothetical protein